MPIPEPGLYRPSRLTKQQKEAHMRVLYGVEMPEQQFSQDELARMRQIIAQNDEQNQPVRTIDLNNPPKEPYRFQAFPKMVYDHEGSVEGKISFAVVKNQEQLQQALENGWVEEAPAFGDWEEDTVPTKYQAEVEQVQGQIDAVKRRVGRPRKEVAVA